MNTAGRRGARSIAAWPRPVRPRLPAWLGYRIQRLLAPNACYRWLAGWLERSPARYRAFAAAEQAAKGELFGCRMCGQCTLPVTGYACPMTCPKQLRNGPCGGVGSDGSCEVYPDIRCVWLEAWERAERHGRVADLHLLQRPVDHRRWGESAWVSYWHGRDDGLWAAGDASAIRDSVPAAERR
ncbi:MAG TPA: methylenetetrahydrofolate reductase C-terminal domain-containing protein [Streptosporangiaceae bacterium]|nr:methylenetetrahydrofolate reductase C-terminal domain-containing protein [Streptosporangiaceae bacterium]